MEIQAGKRKSSIDTSPPKSQQVVSCRQKTKAFTNTQTKSEITRENQLMLGKLIDISQRKQNRPYGGVPQLPKTLNELNRREDNRRIVAENQIIAKRLVDRQPTVSTKDLAAEFSNVERYRKGIAKVKIDKPKF